MVRLMLLHHLKRVEAVLVVAHQLVAVVDLIKEERVVDAQHLVLKKRLVYLTVLFLAIRSFLLLLRLLRISLILSGLARFTVF